MMQSHINVCSLSCLLIEIENIFLEYLVDVIKALLQ